MIENYQNRESQKQFLELLKGTDEVMFKLECVLLSVKEHPQPLEVSVLNEFKISIQT